MEYRCIVADPPWNERGGGRRGAQNHYPLMRTPDIARVMLDSPAFPTKRAHFWLWVTANYMADGIAVLEGMGFRYVRWLVWVKQKDGKLQQGLGQYLRGSSELCLLGVKGHTMLDASVSESDVIIAPRDKHSSKPDAAFERIAQVSPGPRIELFARQPREGWNVWGNEVE